MVPLLKLMELSGPLHNKFFGGHPRQNLCFTICHEGTGMVVALKPFRIAAWWHWVVHMAKLKFR